MENESNVVESEEDENFLARLVQFAEEQEEEGEEGEDEEVEEDEEAATLAALAQLVETVPEKKLRRRPVRRKREQKVASLQTNPAVTEFFTGRMKDPQHYTYTAEGNLQISGVKGVPDKVIRMDKRFVPFNAIDYETLEQARKDKMKEVETDYIAALADLRKAQEAYKLTKDKSSAAEVVRKNNLVLEKSILVSRAAFPEVWVNVIGNIQTNLVLMQYDPYEIRKLGYPINIFKHSEFSIKDSWGKYQERTGEEEKEEMEGGGIRIRFITDVEDKATGHFHPFYLRNFVFHETEYCSPYQAYQAERFKELGEVELRKQILGTRSGRTMHTLALRNTTLPKTPSALWEDILFHFFHQHKDLAKELEDTGSDKFHVMDKQIPAEVGPALEKARLKLRELGDTEVQDQEIKEKAITEEEQKKAKVGAIVNNFRRKF